MRTQPLLLPLLSASLLLGACSSDEDTHNDAPAHTDNHESEQAPSNRIDIPATVRRNLGITFAPVERRQVEQTIRIPGVFELQPLARHEYRMILPGEVALEVDQYQQVQAQEVLYRFRSPKWPELQHEIIVSEQEIKTAEAKISVAQAQITQAELRLKQMRDRLTALAQAEFRRADLEAEAAEQEATITQLVTALKVSQTQHANAQTTREHAMHRASAATGLDEAVLNQAVEQNGTTVAGYRTIDWISVRAKKPGIVQSLALTDGAYADAPTLVLSTVDLSQVRFRAAALQADLTRLTGDITARIVPPGPVGSAEESLDASITLGLEAHPEQRTVSLIATPTKHRPWVRPGVSAFLEVVMDSTAQPALAIPRSAIVKDGIVHVFFRRDPNDPNKAIRVEADMGVSDGRWVVINSGLSLKDEIVLEGAYELKLASQQSGADQKGGHIHADGTFHATDH